MILRTGSTRPCGRVRSVGLITKWGSRMAFEWPLYYSTAKGQASCASEAKCLAHRRILVRVRGVRDKEETRRESDVYDLVYVQYATSLSSELCGLCLCGARVRSSMRRRPVATRVAATHYLFYYRLRDDTISVSTPRPTCHTGPLHQACCLCPRRPTPRPTRTRSSA